MNRPFSRGGPIERRLPASLITTTHLERVAMGRGGPVLTHGAGDEPAVKGKKSVKGRKRSNSREESIHCAKSIINETVAEHLPVRSVHNIDVSDGHLGMTLCNHPLGVLISEVNESDKAWNAGLRQGDVIISINGELVTGHRQAASLMFEQSTLKLEFYEAVSCERFLVRRRKPSIIVSFHPKEGYLGLTISRHPLGLLVVDTDPCDLAHAAGLRVGDVIVTVNGEAVNDHQRALNIIEGCERNGQRIRLTYHKAEAAAIELVLTGTDYVSFQHGCTVSSHTHRGDAPGPGCRGDSFIPREDSRRGDFRLPEPSFKEQHRQKLVVAQKNAAAEQPSNDHVADMQQPNTGSAIRRYSGLGDILIADASASIRGGGEPNDHWAAEERRAITLSDPYPISTNASTRSAGSSSLSTTTRSAQTSSSRSLQFSTTSSSRSSGTGTKTKLASLRSDAVFASAADPAGAAVAAKGKASETQVGTAAPTESTRGAEPQLQAEVVPEAAVAVAVG